MELLTYICVILLGIVMLIGAFVMIGLMAALATIWVQRLRRQARVAWRTLRRSLSAGFAKPAAQRAPRRAQQDKHMHLARSLWANFLAATGLASISGYLVWALAF